MKETGVIRGNPFAGSGLWFRGNLHSHTTGSDGLLSAVELASWYRDRGYHFLFITDHNRVTDVSDCRLSGMLVMPGAEILLHWEEPLKAEILALGIDRVAPIPAGPQEVIDDVLSQQGLAFLSHPALSGIPSAAIARLRGLAGIEIFNAPNHWNGRRGFSTSQWDELLATGHFLWGVASDDRHSGHVPELIFPPLGKQSFRDQAEAWIVLRASELRPGAILEALRQGQFYSTTGPEIKDIRVENGELCVETSPVRWVWFASLPWLGIRRVAEPGESLTEARAPLAGLASRERVERMLADFSRRGCFTRAKKVGHYVRLEIWDGGDGYAWSNPIDLSLLPQEG